MALEHSTPSAGAIGDREPRREPDPDAAYERERDRRMVAAAEADDQLGELLEGMEAVDWRHIPTFSVAEAAALTARLAEAREAVQECGLDE